MSVLLFFNTFTLIPKKYLYQDLEFYDVAVLHYLSETKTEALSSDVLKLGPCMFID